MSTSIRSFLEILKCYGIEPEKCSILDIGCGNGKFTLELGKIFGRVVTIDSQPDAIRKLKCKIADMGLLNISALHLDASSLPTLGDNLFDVILTRNSLHFIKDIPKFYDDVKFLLRCHGIFIKVSSPLFEIVYPEDSHKSFLINSELKNFTENKFEDQLNKYWMDFVKINFVKYCDPFRKEKKPFLSKIGEFEQQTSVELHLIDLKEQIKDLTVIDNFISEEGEDIFENLYEEFLQNIYFFLDYEPCDLYFENILLLRKDTYYVEVHFKSDSN